jgi:hypothetical protein
MKRAVIVRSVDLNVSKMYDIATTPTPRKNFPHNELANFLRKTIGCGCRLNLGVIGTLVAKEESEQEG